MDPLLPVGWSRPALAELVVDVVAVNPGSDPEAPICYIDIGAIDSATGTVATSKIISGRDAPSRARQRIKTGDVLFSLVRPGLRAIASVPALTNPVASTGFCVLSAASGVEPRFLYHWVRNEEFLRAVVALQRGVSYPAVRALDLLRQAVPLAPSLEQAKIVERLEALLSNLDAGVAELHAAQRKLTVYRQSVLKAAVEGGLTAGWRDEPRAGDSTGPETGEQLLQRILVERRLHWEAKQLALSKQHGKAQAKDWKSRYVEPVALDVTALPGLPDGWVWASLGQLLYELHSGAATTSGRDVTPFPVLKSSAVRAGVVDFAAVNYLQASQSERQDNYLAPGDVLITRLSGSIDYVGCCAVVGALPVAGIQYPDRIFCGKLPPSLQWLGDWLVICFAGAHVRRRIELATKSGAGHKRISLGDLHPMPIPLPPPAEIAQLIMQTGAHLQSLALLAADVERGLRLAAAQRRNLLKCAFSGQLVPQDPADEPACALLARIQAARVARAAKATAQAPKSRPRPPASRTRTSAC